MIWYTSSPDIVRNDPTCGSESSVSRSRRILKRFWKSSNRENGTHRSTKKSIHTPLLAFLFTDDQKSIVWVSSCSVHIFDEAGNVLDVVMGWM